MKIEYHGFIPDDYDGLRNAEIDIKSYVLTEKPIDVEDKMEKCGISVCTFNGMVTITILPCADMEDVRYVVSNLIEHVKQKELEMSESDINKMFVDKNEQIDELIEKM